MENDLLIHKKLLLNILLGSKCVITNIMGVKINDKLILDYYHTLNRLELCDSETFKVITTLTLEKEYFGINKGNEPIKVSKLYDNLVTKLVKSEEFKIWQLSQFINN